MTLTPTPAPTSAGRRRADAVANVRTEMGRRGLGHGQTVGDALRLRRVAERLLDTHRAPRVRGGF
jgi:hypothetical protein